MSSSSVNHDSSVELEVTPLLNDAMKDCMAGKLHSPAMQQLSSGTKAILKDIASLQARAEATLGKPMVENEVWWITRRAIQQATTHDVANFKAAWFGEETVADICCGIGGDLIALARRGKAIGVDYDTSVLSFTRANLHTANVSAELRCLDAQNTPADTLLDGADYLHIDPDRRSGSQRHVRPEEWMPTWDKTFTLLKQSKGALVKMAPATELDDAVASECHRMWISSSGSVREQTAIWGQLPCIPLSFQSSVEDVRSDHWLGGRSAVVLKSGEPHVFSGSADQLDVRAEVASKPQQWMIDPDAAVRAAGLTDAFAVAHGAAVLGKPSGFLTSDSPLSAASDVDASTSQSNTLAIVAKIRDQISCDDRALRRYFRKQNSYPEIIKIRGVDMDPAKLQKKLRQCGDQPVAMWIGRNGKKTFAVITDLPLN
ncbi:methyltransferase domain-containing protein [Rhodopirellula sp. JC740]|uniref:Methyltransferase domain-containing protein n=1 Tax=Rhodopirellula halodulae TaxID=2894198 RepID=A0ABS8ND46_9BACT|nr:methyltransferase domain-containing protein [Rhodopirellula sp. JC740]